MANLYDQATQRQKWDQTIEQVQKMGYPQNPVQPLAAAPAPPRQAQSPAESTPGVMPYGEQMRNVGSALLSLPAAALKTIVSAPGYGLNKPSTPEPVTTPAAPNPADQRLAAGTQTAPLPTPVKAPNPDPVQVNTATPPPLSGGPISPRNMAAADALAASQTGASMSLPTAAQPGVATPVAANSTNDWAARNNLRNLAVSASSITANGGRFDQSGRGDSPEVSAYKAALANDHALQQAQPGLAAVAMRENAGIQREGMQQQGANTRSLGQIALEQQKINQTAATQGIDNRGKTLVQDLQSQIATEPDSAKRQEMAQRLREMQGQSTADPYLVVPGGQAVDEMGKPYNMPSTVFNRQTQQFVQQPKQGGQSPYPEGQKLTGKDGKAYVVKNGVPVPA